MTTRSKSLVFLLPIILAASACSGSPEPSPPTEPLAEGIGCSTWASAAEIGALDHEAIPEASGLEVSSRFPDRLYHINDSGDSGRFFVTARDGSGTRIVRIEGFEPSDTEDIAIGQCPAGGGSCLFIADVGANVGMRNSLEVVVIEEQEQYPETVIPLFRFRFRYPEGPGDAEAFAVHPNGDIFIITKRANYLMLTASASQIFRIPRLTWVDPSAGVIVAEHIGELDLTAISSDRFSGSLPTALDIYDDGSRFLVLTYVNAFEFYFDLTEAPLPETTEMVRGRDYNQIELVPLAQQESVAYVPRSEDFLYETELEPSQPGFDSSGRARIMQVLCQD